MYFKVRCHNAFIVSFYFSDLYTSRQHDVHIYSVSDIPAGFPGFLLLQRPGPWTQSRLQQRGFMVTSVLLQPDGPQSSAKNGSRTKLERHWNLQKGVSNTKDKQEERLYSFARIFWLFAVPSDTKLRNSDLFSGTFLLVECQTCCSFLKVDVSFSVDLLLLLVLMHVF